MLCFTSVARRTAISNATSVVRAAGGVGLIVAKNPSDDLAPCSNDFPCVEVDYEVGTQILFYIRSTRCHRQSFADLPSLLTVYYIVSKP